MAEYFRRYATPEETLIVWQRELNRTYNNYTTTLPWLIDINVFATAGANTNWDIVVTNTSSVYYGLKQSSGAQNDDISWDVILAAGTWAVEIMHNTQANNGIYSVQFDGVEKGTIDGYSVANTHNVRSNVAGIVVSATAKITLKLAMATKHASSSNYFGRIQYVRLLRTA